MLKYIYFLLLLFILDVYSQEAGLFKIPPPGMNLPAILNEDEVTVKYVGLGAAESKWITSVSENSVKLFGTFSSSKDNGLVQMIRNILTSANIPEDKIKKLKIRFTSGSTEELGIDKDAILFKDDFADKYKTDKLYVVTKLFRTKDAKLEITDENASEIDQAVSSTLSERIIFGNKTESIVQNTMIIEFPYIIYGFEKNAISISRIQDQRETVIIGVETDVNINSLYSLKSLEGRPGDFFIKIGSKGRGQLIEFNVTTENRSLSFRVNNREAYTLSFYEKKDNRLTVTFTGFMVNFE